MKEPHTGIGICHCRQCRMDKKHCSSKKRKFEKRAINKFRRKQLKSNQSPWISVKEKAGCDSSNDCIVMDSDGEVFRACFIRNKWLKYNRGYYVIDNVTHWMPIPSFDEILEANRDVLERIKEKGD